ncbi:MAG: SMC-Scp complex subunit ScpB [candidate division NC10 bacterium]|nr:SMC-Scp complex subunit ScpB [candidate division NC10 bacterium]
MDGNQVEPSEPVGTETAAAGAPAERLDRRGILEALLFVVDEPIPLAKLREVLGDAEESQTSASLSALALALEQMGFGLMVQEVAGGFRLTTRPEAHPWIQRLQQVKPTRLSRAALETLAIIAYRQPITKAEVEQIRGVAIDGVLRTLLERELVRILGRKADAGRPILYGTSQQFLEHFGFRALGDLPSLREIDELVGPPPSEEGSPRPSTADLPGQSRGLYHVEEEAVSPPAVEPAGDRDVTDSAHDTPPAA